MKHYLLLLLSTFLLSMTTHAAAPTVTPLTSYSASLQSPTRVATDSSGNVYVVDSPSGCIVVFDAFGRVTATHSGFNRPLGIAVDASGHIYLGEEQSGSITVLDPQWTPLYKLGSGNGEFSMPNFIATDAPSNTVYVSDSKANTIKVYSGATLINQFGTGGTNNGAFDFPAGIAVSTGGEVFVMDQNNDRVQIFDRNGVYLRQMNFMAGTNRVPTGRRQGLLLDNAGRLYVTDSFNAIVTVYDATTGTPLGTLGNFGLGAGNLNLPAAVCMDPFNRLLVTSANNGRLELYGIDNYLHLTATPATLDLASGTNLVFTASLGGTGPFSFEWRRNATNLLDGITINGSTNSTLTISGATPADSGLYSVIITGPTTITSSVAQVAISDPPTLIGGPYSPTVLRGDTVDLSVTATGPNLTYQWQHNNLNIAGATNDTLTLTGVQPSDAGTYGVLIKNAVGALSRTATVTVLSPPLVMEFLGIAIQPDQSPILTINSDPGANYSLDASDDLSTWSPLFPFLNTAGILNLTDPDTTNTVHRFYRLRWLP